MELKTKHRFKEGDVREFIILNTIDLSGTEFYILKDEFDRKQMLAAEFYLNFGFKNGQKIRCRIDKINCAGKIFLEPENPFYTVGQTYPFKFHSGFIKTNSIGKKEKYIKVIDRTGKMHELWVPDHFIPHANDNPIELYLARIRKGEFLLILPEFTIPVNSYLIGMRCRFTITGICELVHDKAYFLLEGEDGTTHFLRTKFYQSYAFKIGDEIFGSIVKMPRPCAYYFEPDYPGYTIGEPAYFDFENEDIYYHSSGKQEDVWVVKDKNDKKCYLFFSEKPDERQKEKPVQAIVEKIYKGKLYLRY